MKIILLQKPFTYVLFREVPRNSTFFGTGHSFEREPFKDPSSQV
jgi:hypothetical protein